MAMFDVLYKGLQEGWLGPDDLSPDLAGIQIWVRLAKACPLHDDDGCHSLAVHEFGLDTPPTLYSHCDPDGPLPPTTDAIAGVRFLWSDGRAEVVGPTQAPYLHPIIARLQPS